MQAILAPAAEQPTTELARDMLTVMAHVFRQSGSGYYELIESLELTMTQLRTLHELERAEDRSLKELAELAGTSLATTSRNVDALLRRGYVERREDEYDRRIRRIRLTPRGRETLARVDATKLAGLEAFAATLTESQRARLRNALACLVERAVTT